MPARHQPAPPKGAEASLATVFMGTSIRRKLQTLWSKDMHQHYGRLKVIKVLICPSYATLVPPNLSDLHDYYLPTRSLEGNAMMGFPFKLHYKLEVTIDAVLSRNSTRRAWICL
jgi:hypothetical protein